MHVLELLASVTKDSAVSNTFDPLTKVINSQNAQGQTALMLACKGGHYACAKLLTSKGASPLLADAQVRGTTSQPLSQRVSPRPSIHPPVPAPPPARHAGPELSALLCPGRQPGMYADAAEESRAVGLPWPSFAQAIRARALPVSYLSPHDTKHSTCLMQHACAQRRAAPLETPAACLPAAAGSSTAWTRSAGLRCTMLHGLATWSSQRRCSQRAPTSWPRRRECRSPQMISTDICGPLGLRAEGEGGAEGRGECVWLTLRGGSF